MLVKEAILTGYYMLCINIDFKNQLFRIADMGLVVYGNLAFSLKYNWCSCNPCGCHIQHDNRKGCSYIKNSNDHKASQQNRILRTALIRDW